MYIYNKNVSSKLRSKVRNQNNCIVRSMKYFFDLSQFIHHYI